MQKRNPVSERSWETPAMRELFKTILKLKTPKECSDFFRDVATLAELQALAERWWVARLLDEGVSYRKIAEQTGVSTTTITRVAYWIESGRGGYKRMLKRTQPKKKTTPRKASRKTAKKATKRKRKK